MLGTVIYINFVGDEFLLMLQMIEIQIEIKQRGRHVLNLMGDQVLLFSLYSVQFRESN